MSRRSRLLYSAFEQIRVDRTFIDIEERDVIESDLMKQDDEFYEVGVGLLPEGFLAPAEQVVQQRSDVVGEGVGVEVVVKRVVAVLGFEADFDVVAGASVPREDFLHLPAEVAFHFKNESADAPVGVFGAIGQNLLGEGIHADCRFSRADRPDDGDAREKASFRNDQPVRCFRRDLFAGVMDLAHDERKFCPLSEVLDREAICLPESCGLP